jgi:hypothetical protein
MIIEKDEKSIIKTMTNQILDENNLSKVLTSIDDLKSFFEVLAKNQKIKDDAVSQYIAFYMYHKFSERDVRLRKVSSRTFEEFIGGIYGLQPTDDESKPYPSISEDIQLLSDELLSQKDSNESLKKLMSDWSIAHDLQGNKREKADIVQDDVEISIKTLKGKLECDSANTEINIGSMSFRSLFVNIYNEKLGDRKAGLGSGAQMLKVLKKIESEENMDIFKKRVAMFLHYLYSNDDFFIAYKSDVRMQLFFFKGLELVELLTKLLEKDIKLFSEIFYRWENNNLRIQINKLLNPTLTNLWSANDISEITDFPMYHGIPNPFSKKNMVILNLQTALENKKLLGVIDNVNEEYIQKLTTTLINISSQPR